ncbi:MAG: ribonuclease HI [Spirochaetales bacterium]|nr:ribonuclease HI [Spirochaetales bacterium]
MKFSLPPLVQKIVDEFAALSGVEGIALGGARSQGVADARSDFDLYVYVEKIPDLENRRKILEPVCRRSEVGNTFWEVEDDVVLNDGTVVELIFRVTSEFEHDVAGLVEGFQPRTGYSTCVWGSLSMSVILFDRQGKLDELKKRFSIPYPEALAESIIGRNWPLLGESVSAYPKQAETALDRGDWIALRHRTDAFLASYFDVLFAFNKVPHPGEKRLVERAHSLCERLPGAFQENLDALRRAPESEVPACLSRLTSALGEFLAQKGSKTVPTRNPTPLQKILIHTDGGCLGNPGKGGWAFLARSGEVAFEGSGFEPVTTNNRMELLAVIRALEAVEQRCEKAAPEVEIRTDSQYVKNGISVWIKGWEANGWKTAAKEPVKNQELWKRLRELDLKLHPRWSWVKGHAGNPDNEYCDRLVRQTMENS